MTATPSPVPAAGEDVELGGGATSPARSALDLSKSAAAVYAAARSSELAPAPPLRPSLTPAPAARVDGREAVDLAAGGAVGAEAFAAPAGEGRSTPEKTPAPGDDPGQAVSGAETPADRSLTMATAIHTTISALVHVKPGTRIEAHEDFEQTTAWLSVGANGPGPDSHVTLFMGLPDLWRLRSALADLERLLVAQAKASDRCYCGKPASGIGYLPGEVDAYPRACTDHAVPTTVAEPARVVDLMASLEESLAAAKNRATA